MCKLMKLTVLCGVLFFFKQGIAISQTSESKKLEEYREYPHWIHMKEDSSVNYFEAVKAFDEFWKDRKAPIEDDATGEAEKDKEKEWTLARRILHTKEYKLEKESEAYRFEHKKFKHWQLTVEPYVQPDGRILTSDEQLEIWKTQRK